jgi:hypothetical protein
MGETWYFARDGRRMGPFSFEQLQQMAASGVLDANDMMLRLGEQQWLPARSVDGLFSIGPSEASTTPNANRTTEQIEAIPSSPPPIQATTDRNAPVHEPRSTTSSLTVFDESLPPDPTFVRTAGIIWTVFGSLVLAILLFSLAATKDELSGAFAAVIIGSFAVAFLYVGIQTANGWARDVIANGIGSLVFGFSGISGGIPTLPAGIVFVVSGVALFAAGVFALIGRSDYKTWRRLKERYDLAN